jgi:hypothetical protein
LGRVLILAAVLQERSIWQFGGEFYGEFIWVTRLCPVPLGHSSPPRELPQTPRQLESFFLQLKH